MNLAPVESHCQSGPLRRLYPLSVPGLECENQQRWTFGGVYPRDYARQDETSPCEIQTECLVQGSLETEIEVHVRFLHLVRREVGEFASPMIELPAGEEPPTTKVGLFDGGRGGLPELEEAIERDVATPL